MFAPYKGRSALPGADLEAPPLRATCDSSAPSRSASAADLDRQREVARATQREAIKAHLLAGHRLTPFEALERGWGMRLGARVHELRASGLDIASTMVAVERPDGSSVRVASYWLRRAAP